MRLTLGKGVVDDVHRFDGHVCEAGRNALVWIDQVGAAFCDNGALKYRAEWQLSGRVADPADPQTERTQLPAPEWAELQGPTLVQEPPARLKLVPPCYLVTFTPRQLALFELTVTIALGADRAEGGVRVRSMPAGALAESAQQKLERMLRTLDVEGARKMLEPGSADDADSADELAEEDADGSAAGDGFAWVHSKTGENLVGLMLEHEEAGSPSWQHVLRALVRAGATPPLPAEPAAGGRGDARPSLLHVAVDAYGLETVAALLERPDAFPAHALCLWRGRRCTTPLHVACAAGDLPMACLLLARGARPDWAGLHGHGGSETPLALAISAGSVELARLLLVEKRADIKLRTLDPRCARPNVPPLPRPATPPGAQPPPAPAPPRAQLLCARACQPRAGRPADGSNAPRGRPRRRAQRTLPLGAPGAPSAGGAPDGLRTRAARARARAGAARRRRSRARAPGARLRRLTRRPACLSP